MRRLIEAVVNTHVFNKRRHQYKQKSHPVSEFHEFTKVVPLLPNEASMLSDLYAKLSIPEHDDPRNAYVNTDRATFQARFDNVIAIETAVISRKIEVPTPGEHKTVQSRILAYAQAIGWRFVPRAAAEMRRSFDPDGVTPEDCARTASLYFGDLLHAQVCAFNPKYKDAEGALVGEFQRLNSDIAGNRDFLTYLRNQGKVFCTEENRELDLKLIDYADLTRPREQWLNVYEVTDEFYVHNGHHGTREDLVFLINGIPVLVIECKNASKDEAIALAVDQLRRYHAETPEVMVPEMIFSATEAIGFAYGVTWNTVRRNIFNWKHTEAGNLEAKVKRGL